jgi:uncharacterized membrane protein YphA (DoxX/SURF4 family)
MDKINQLPLTKTSLDGKVPPILITAMFFLSGFHKLINFDKTVNNFKGKISYALNINQNINEYIYNYIIYAVIVLEILAPVIIVYYHTTGKFRIFSNYAVYGLIFFTILATLLYHPLNINDYYKSIPFWANISLIGGLLLLFKKSNIKN